jgi:hypothetical protein
MGVQQLQKYDGKVEDVPAQWVIDGSLADSEHRERKNLGWDSDGDVIPANPLDWALPIKRSRHQSPVST